MATVPAKFRRRAPARAMSLNPDVADVHQIDIKKWRAHTRGPSELSVISQRPKGITHAQ
jgi:hypothetical protein